MSADEIQYMCYGQEDVSILQWIFLFFEKDFFLGLNDVFIYIYIDIYIYILLHEVQTNGFLLISFLCTQKESTL